MRLFQLITFGSPYLQYFDASRPARRADGFAQQLDALLEDRYGNSHLLQPVERREPHTFLSIGDDNASQRAWARERGMPADTAPDDIVLAQIEDHRTEVFYNVSPLLYDTKFLRRLPGSVKRTLCWRAAPVGRADLSGYDLCVCNFQGLLDEWSRLGWKTAWFQPAHDPVASQYASSERDIDVAFVGGYSRLHGRRNVLLQRVAQLAPRYRVRFHFSLGRSARLVNSLGPLRGMFPHLALVGSLHRVAGGPLFGRAMYSLFGSSHIVINAAIDMANEFRGNMRCWEAMGCGALMLSDDGVYPPGMQAGRDFETYRDADEALDKIERILARYNAWRPMAEQGRSTIETTFSKAAQWAAFVELVSRI